MMWRMFLWLFLINMYTVAVAISCLESISHDCNHRKVSHSPESQEPETWKLPNQDKMTEDFKGFSSHLTEKAMRHKSIIIKKVRTVAAKQKIVLWEPGQTIRLSPTRKRRRLVVTGEQQRQSCSCKVHRNVLRIHCMVILWLV